jgi:hypothetical protein
LLGFGQVTQIGSTAGKRASEATLISWSTVRNDLF